MRTLGLAALLFAVGCSSGIGSDAECPPEGTTLTYDNFGKAYFDQHCLACHSESLSGTDRQSAPVGVNFDTLEKIRVRLESIDRRRHDMPPSDHPQPSADEKQKLSEWLACGAP